METEYSSYRLGMSKKRACWLSDWLNDKVSSRKVTAKEMQQGLGRLGFAAIALDWQRPFFAWKAHHPDDATRPGYESDRAWIGLLFL